MGHKSCLRYLIGKVPQDMAEPPYQRYQVEDFVMDEAFQQWVRHPNTASDQFWQRFLVTYPEQRSTVEEARKLIENIRYQPYILPEARQQQILEAAYAQASNRMSAQKLLQIFPRKYWAVAATFILLVCSALVFWLLLSSYTTYETGYQENKKILLADGSKVTLNANTRLNVNVDAEADQPREVWLEGEAYFEVKQLNATNTKGESAGRKKFIVHTDHFDVEVLGTVFNVTNRAEKSEVLLQSGAVQIASQRIKQTQRLQPGDVLTLTEEDQNFRLEKVETATELAWRANLFVFEDTPLHQVARAMEDYYGLDVMIADPALKDKLFTAKISRDQLPILLKAIEAAFGVTVIRDTEIITIR